MEESGHIQVHEDGEDLLVGEAVEAADVVTLQQILNGFVPFVSSVRSSSGYHGLIEIRSAAAATHFSKFFKFFRF